MWTTTDGDTPVRYEIGTDYSTEGIWETVFNIAHEWAGSIAEAYVNDG